MVTIWTTITGAFLHTCWVPALHDETFIREQMHSGSSHTTTVNSYVTFHEFLKPCCLLDWSVNDVLLVSHWSRELTLPGWIVTQPNLGLWWKVLLTSWCLRMFICVQLMCSGLGWLTILLQQEPTRRWDRRRQHYRRLLIGGMWMASVLCLL
jgi:hypothetical protein